MGNIKVVILHCLEEGILQYLKKYFNTAVNKLVQSIIISTLIRNKYYT